MRTAACTAACDQLSTAQPTFKCEQRNLARVVRVCLSALFAKHPTKPLDREKPIIKRGKRIIKKEEEREEAEKYKEEGDKEGVTKAK